MLIFFVLLFPPLSWTIFFSFSFSYPVLLKSFIPFPLCVCVKTLEKARKLKPTGPPGRTAWAESVWCGVVLFCWGLFRATPSPPRPACGPRLGPRAPSSLPGLPLPTAPSPPAAFSCWVCLSRCPPFLVLLPALSQWLGSRPTGPTYSQCRGGGDGASAIPARGHPSQRPPVLEGSSGLGVSLSASAPRPESSHCSERET